MFINLIVVMVSYMYAYHQAQQPIYIRYTFSHTNHTSVEWFKKRFGSECSIFQIMCSIFQILCICNLIRFFAQQRVQK